jgi:ABC-2 type transport system ATP-binding protein
MDLFVPNGISGFIGKNGAGKTITISILLGLLKPNSGDATIFNLDCWRNSYDIRQRLGVMHEINAYPESFTGKQFLEHVAKIYNISQASQVVKELLNDVGLSEAKDKKIKGYSAGMFRRLGFAQALIGDPELAILDEPTANIDPLGRITLLDTIKQIHKDRGTSFLISTHILSDLEKVCNWLSIIDAGRIVDQGYVKDLTNKYSANMYKIEVSDPELFVKHIEALETVEKTWIEDGKIYCKVKNANKFCEDVPRITANLKIQLKSFQQMLGSLEEIYTQTARND